MPATSRWPCRFSSRPQGNDCIDISKLTKETGLFTYDSGFTATASCKSAITYIDGDNGVLLYRGYPIEQLAKHSSFPSRLPADER